MKTKWKDYLIKTIVAIILLTAYPVYDFYSDIKVSEAIEIVHEKTQTSKIDTNYHHILELQIEYDKTDLKIDSNFAKNQKTNSEVLKSVNVLSENIKTLTYVIENNNKAMKDDLNEIKKMKNTELIVETK